MGTWLKRANSKSRVQTCLFSEEIHVLPSKSSKMMIIGKVIIKANIWTLPQCQVLSCLLPERGRFCYEFQLTDEETEV